MMDRLGLQLAICSDQEALAAGGSAGLDKLRRAYEQSHGRILGQGLFDPRAAERCLGELRDALGWPGLRGLKIHPTMHATPADARAYEPVWHFAAEHDLPLLTHSWSTSSHNAAQVLSTPERFEPFVRRFPAVRFVLGHAGGRGPGRAEAVRLARTYPNVYLDFAGDIFCRGLIENLAAAVSAQKILFGSDFPWISPEAHLTRVLLAPIGEPDKAAILRLNALHVYKLEENPCSR
jgi:predicted TIM-barrel fold metal-dependent hydrolase